MKHKIVEGREGYVCRICGRRFRTEMAAFYHQSYDCSGLPDTKRQTHE